MTSDKTLKEGRLQIKVDDVVFEALTIDDIGLPPFPTSTAPGGYVKRIVDVQNFTCYNGDVLLATFPKCGTHWVREILHLLMQGKKAESSYMVNTFLEEVSDLAIVDKLPRPRIFNSHFPYRWFPRYFRENEGKIIHVRRNPKDAYVSFFYHAKSSGLLGPTTKIMTWSQFFEGCVIQKACLYGDWFTYEKKMERMKKTNKNIYTVLYENLKRDPASEIAKLATFLEIEVTNEFIKEIVEKCSFQNLKLEREGCEKPPEMNKFVAELQENTPHYQIPQMFRKGIVGDWKNHFSVAQNELFDDMYKREMQGTGVEVIYQI